jgi:hypothetical protein
MSNSVSISDDFIDIVTLQNYMLVAFPNFLIISIDNPTYNNKTKKLVFKKNSYIKMRACDLEIWYTYFINILGFFDSGLTSTPRETIIAGKDLILLCDFSYELEGYTNEKNCLEVKLILNGLRSVYFDKTEIMYLLNGISDLNFQVYCYPETINNCFKYLINHYVKMPGESIDSVSKNISMSTISVLLQLCEKCCTKNKINENPFIISQILFRHILNLLITYRIKKMKYLSSPLLIHYQNM